MPDIAELRARYTRVETEVDEANRQITVGLLKPSQRTRIFEMTTSTSGLVLMPMLQAACVRRITDADGKELLFAAPKNRDDMDILLDVLCPEGLEAVERALARLDPPKIDGKPKDPVEEAKN